jgi:heptosyltransferase-1
MSDATGESTSRPRSILIVLLGAIGDVVRGMHVAGALKEADPTTHITWLVEPASSSIVKLNPCIDEVLVFERKNGLRGVLEVRKALRSRTFDVTLDLQRHFKSGLFSWFSRSPKRVGFHRRDAKEFNWLFNTCTIPEQGEEISKIEHYLSFLGEVGVARPAVLKSGLEGVTLDQFSPVWRPELGPRYVGLVLGSSWDTKDWPEEGYGAVIARAHSVGVEQVVLLGDRSRVEMAARLQGVEAPVSIVNLVGRTSLQEAVAVIRGAQACIGPDSGPAHISGAVGTPHVTLFGPTSLTRNVPRGCESFAIASKVGCSPCKRRVCPGLNKVCMRLISPEQVLEQLKLAIAGA